jgi:dTDP-4-amino-4,6-dideoxygalactose transaminase
VPPAVADGCTHSYYVYAIRFDLDELGVTRGAIARALDAEGIPLVEGYVPPLYRQPLYQQRVGFKRGCPWTCGHWDGEVSYEDGICPTAERLHDRELVFADVTRIPLTHEDVDDVADAFEKVLGDVDALRALEPAA